MLVQISMRLYFLGLDRILYGAKHLMYVWQVNKHIWGGILLIKRRGERDVHMIPFSQNLGSHYQMVGLEIVPLRLNIKPQPVDATILQFRANCQAQL